MRKNYVIQLPLNGLLGLNGVKISMKILSLTLFLSLPSALFKPSCLVWGPPAFTALSAEPEQKLYFFPFVCVFVTKWAWLKLDVCTVESALVWLLELKRKWRPLSFGRTVHLVPACLKKKMLEREPERERLRQTDRGKNSVLCNFWTGVC